MNKCGKISQVDLRGECVDVEVVGCVVCGYIVNACPAYKTLLFVCLRRLLLVCIFEEMCVLCICVFSRCMHV